MDRSRPLRVTHLISADLWAGAEVATCHLVEALARSPDLAVSVIALNDGELARRLKTAGVDVELEPEGSRSFVRLAAAVRARLRSADLVHSHRYKENLLAALSGRPWIATEHGRAEPAAGSAALRMRGYLALDRLLKRSSARRVIAVSSEIERALVARIGRRRTVRVWNGVPDPVAASELPAWEDRPPVVGTLGRLAPVKGLELAIEAVARCSDVRLEMVGAGPQRAALEARAAALGARNRISFCGFDPDPLRRVATWRALLVTSLHEGNPVSVIEALSLGTPVLAGPLPGVTEILGESDGGWSLPHRDPERWARRLSELLRDAPAGARASQAARERYLRRFTVAMATRHTVQVYREATGQ